MKYNVNYSLNLYPHRTILDPSILNELTGDN